MWGSERAQALVASDASSKRSLWLWTSLWAPVPKARSSRITLAYPACSLALKASRCPSTKQHTEAFPGRRRLPLSQSFAVSTPEARIHHFRTPCAPLSSRLPRKYSGMPHACRKTTPYGKGRSFSMRYSYGPVANEGGTPYINGRMVFCKALSQALACPFPCWLGTPLSFAPPEAPDVTPHLHSPASTQERQDAGVKWILKLYVTRRARLAAQER